jgi:AbrB family looped-hinge helix DNA binding protein
MPFPISEWFVMQLTIDHARRVVFPKSLRDGLHLQGGETLELEQQGDALRLVRPKAAMRKKKLPGTMIYDSLLLACARKISADVIYTFNIKHFIRAAPDLADPIQTPPPPR